MNLLTIKFANDTCSFKQCSCKNCKMLLQPINFSKFDVESSACQETSSKLFLLTIFTLFICVLDVALHFIVTDRL